MSPKDNFLPYGVFLFLKHNTVDGVSLSRKITVKSMDIEGLNVKGVMLQGLPEAIAVFKRKNNLVANRSVSILHRDRVCNVLGFKNRKATCGDSDVFIRTEEPDWVKQYPSTLISVGSTLRTLAKSSGYGFNLVFCNYNSMIPPPNKKGLVNIVLGTSPPGPKTDIASDRLCGMWLETTGMSIIRSGPVRAYGTVVNDDKDHPIAQIVGSTIYLLLPVGHPECMHLYNKEVTADLFGKAMTLAWNSYIGKRKEPARELIKTEEVFYGHVNGKRGQIREVLEKHGKAIDDDLREVGERLTELLFRKHQHNLMYGKVFEGALDFDRNDANEHWERLSSNLMITRIYVVSGALQIETKQIVAEHDGKNYQLGSYIIRCPLGGSPSVWALKPMHPNGIAHPHISESGIVCFGNMATAIRSAAAQENVSFAFESIIRWLQEGYDPSLADEKIEKWPEVK